MTPDELDQVLERALDPEKLLPSEAVRRIARSFDPPIRSRWRRAVLVLLPAAGVVIGVTLGRWLDSGERVGGPPSERRTAAERALDLPTPIGIVASATGPVEVAVPTSSGFAVARMGEPLPSGTRVRTSADTLALVELAQGGSVRLGPGTELVILAARSLELLAGRVLTSVIASPEVFRVRSGGDVVETFDSKLDLQRSLEGDLDRTELLVWRGVARLGSESVESGFRCASVDGVVGRPERLDELERLDRWVDDLLRVEGRDSEELATRVDELLTQLGRTKMEQLYEWEIRSLAPGCVVPLIRYVRSETTSSHRTRTATRLIADLASREHLDEVLELLKHADSNVRRAGARALQRITGTDLGFADDYWQSGDTAAGLERWQDWRRRAFR